MRLRGPRSLQETILDKKTFNKWVDKLAKAPVFNAFDTETTSIDAMQARLVGECHLLWRRERAPTCQWGMITWMRLPS